MATEEHLKKRVLVTGSSRGIGRAIAERLSADGFQVVTHAVKSPDADLHFDVADREETRRVIEADIEANGVYYGVVANAGVAADAPFPILEGDMWDRVIDTDLTGFYNVLKPIVMPMVSARVRGRIVALTASYGYSTICPLNRHDEEQYPHGGCRDGAAGASPAKP